MERFEKKSSSVDYQFIKTTTAALIIAVVGYVATYVNDVAMMSRKEKLERVNAQLKQLYGPLYSLTMANDSTWREFRKIYRPDKPFAIDSSMTAKEKKIWVKWMSSVFMPINEKMYKAITENTDLIIDDKFPKVFKAFCVHEQSYIPVVADWKNGDYSRLSSSFNYPDSITGYVSRSYGKLKQDQKQLLSNYW